MESIFQARLKLWSSNLQYKIGKKMDGRTYKREIMKGLGLD